LRGAEEGWLGKSDRGEQQGGEEGDQAMHAQRLSLRAQLGNPARMFANVRSDTRVRVGVRVLQRSRGWERRGSICSRIVELKPQKRGCRKALFTRRREARHLDYSPLAGTVSSAQVRG
jgi:hypothetical protein